MKFHPFSLVLVGMVMAIAPIACTSEISSDTAPTSEAPTETVPEPPVVVESGVDAPAEATLQTYDGAAYNYPINAQYPDTMQAEGGCSGEGCGFTFTFAPQGNAMDDAEVHIFLPAGTATAAEQEPFVTGPNGLIENAGWTVDSTQDESEQFPYPWVETVINFSTDQEETGHILLGETNGQAVQVLLKYPAEMADTYWADAKTVLDTLEFNADFLPIAASSEGPAE